MPIISCKIVIITPIFYGGNFKNGLGTRLGQGGNVNNATMDPMFKLMLFNESCFYHCYRVMEIGKSQRATLVPLKENALPLKNKIPYDQLLPYVTSELHNIQHTQQETDTLLSSDDNIPPSCDNDVPPSCDNIPPSCDNIPPSCDNIPPSFDNIPPSCDNDIPPDNSDIDKNNDNIPATSTNNIKRLQKDRKPRRKALPSTPKHGILGKLVLTTLKKHYWLTDEHIDHAQWLLSKQYPTAKGLHSVLAFQCKSPKVERLEEFVQILNVGGKHWVTATNIGCEGNKVKVFDSLSLKLSKKDEQSLAALLDTSLPDMTIEWPSMQQQSGTTDCGLFAIAVAVSLCNGDNPSLQCYDQSVMREHLAMCFQCEEIGVFPVLPQSRHVVGDSVKRNIELFCHCRIPYMKGVFMIECSKCFGWFHRSCDKVPKTVNKNTSFHCINCK